MPFSFRALFGQPRMCREVADPFCESEESDEFKKTLCNKNPPITTWGREALLLEGSVINKESLKNDCESSGVVLPPTAFQRNEGVFSHYKRIFGHVGQSQKFGGYFFSTFNYKEPMERDPKYHASNSKKHNLSLPIASCNSSPPDIVKGLQIEYNHASKPKGTQNVCNTGCKRVPAWQCLPQSVSVSDDFSSNSVNSSTANIADCIQVSSELSAMNVVHFPDKSTHDKYAIELSCLNLQSRKIQVRHSMGEPNYILSGDLHSKSNVSSSTSALDESPPSLPSENEKDTFYSHKDLCLQMYLQNNIRLEEGSRLPVDPEPRPYNEHRVRRSSIKSSRSKRRSRHSSGHSVTFDLPDDCDNLGLPQIKPSERPLELTQKEDSLYSKAVKETSNESIKHCEKLLQCQSNVNAMQCYDNGPNTTTTNLDLWSRVECQNRVDQNFAEDNFPKGTLSHSQFNNIDNSHEYADPKRKSRHPDKHSTPAEGESPSSNIPNVSRKISSSEITTDLNDPSTSSSSLPNSWVYGNSVGLLSPLRTTINSIAWSSTESSSESSDPRGLDSGYWGTGLRTPKGDSTEGFSNPQGARCRGTDFLKAQKDVGIASKRKCASKKYRMTRKGGVKVVTQGMQYFLPYAYLEEGRIKLNIVRDEYLEETGCALTVRDVSELLHAQYAIITGGKSRDNCPIITFPDLGNFQQLGDEEYRKLIIYLTSVPSLQEADLGFVLVIDRRTDKWNSVKSVLLKISGFFPGLITVAYVLRPGGFLQKAISEVSSKIFREEFKFKVVVCNCLYDLHTVIDKNQLTESLEGCIPYIHEEWIEQRVAVEKFSANTQEISGSLRVFTQSLQETEFPNDVCSCEELLRSQTTDFHDLKEDLLSASRHGEALLNCIKRPGEPRNLQMCPDKLINVTAVERLLVQLEETEKTFDDFWTQHESRLTQCLQLRRFESDFKELQPILEESIKELSLLTETGDSVARVDELIQETQLFHQNCTDQLEKAEELRSMGSLFIENDHYAVDSIQPKCIELIRMRENFHDLITGRLHKLHKCRELEVQIDKINNWCAAGVELLASQQMERFQTPEQAEDALKELEVFLTSSDLCASGAANEMREMFEDVITQETKALVQQVVKRLEDVLMMCEKKKISLKKLTSRLPRPIHAVTPEPAIPFHHVLPSPSASVGHNFPQVHSHPGSPLHHHSCGDLTKSPKSLRKASTLSKLETDIDSPDCLPDPEAAKAKRGHVLKELLETERVYVTELCSILKGYKDEMMNTEMQHQIPINLYGKADILFGNMEEIFRFHNDIFLRDLENCINTPELIGLCFVQRKDTFHHLYSFYCQNKPQSEELRRQVGDCNSFFKECQSRLGHKLPLGAYLLKPVQRITKYQLLLKDLLKCVEGTQGRRELQEAVDTMLTVLKCLNDSMHQVAITGYPGVMSELGRLLMQGPFCVWNDSKKGLRDLRLKPAQRHLFLYETILLFTKRAGKDTDRETYHFKNALKMSKIGLTENVKGNKGDMKKFEVWLQGRQEVYTILASSLEVKETWVKEIKKVLFDQFEYLKGENIKQYSARIQKGASLNGMRVPPLSPTAQHRTLRQTASWDVAGGSSVSSSSSDSGKTTLEGRESNRRSKTSKSSDATSLGDAPEEEEESWSSEYSPSDEEEDQETFSENTEFASSRFLVLADYNAMGSSEVSLRDGDTVDLIKVGCAGWWYVRVSGAPFEGWAPAAYLERVVKKNNRSSPSVSSQESSSGMRPATSRSSVASVSNKSDEVQLVKQLTN